MNRVKGYRPRVADAIVSRKLAGLGGLIIVGPKWCGKIVSGEKTIEVRKTRPKMETPFKCYIYCTKEQ